MSVDVVANTCVFALFVLFSFQGEKISTILKAANVDVEPYWPSLFAKALEGVNVKDLITNIGSGVGAAPAAGGAAPAAAAAAPEAKKEEKKEESEEEEDDDMGKQRKMKIAFPTKFFPTLTSIQLTNFIHWSRFIAGFGLFE